MASTGVSSRGVVLVAEDETSIREICCRVLKDAGFEVLQACDGDSAVELVDERGESLELIIADVVMPGSGGEVIWNHLKEIELEVPVIFTSGYSHHSDVVKFLEGQNATLLRKPYTLAQLLATVRGVLEE